ncbi:MAG: SGNH/GDSL hydrolase family protein [Pseudomonadota bacterium]
MKYVFAAATACIAIGAGAQAATLTDTFTSFYSIGDSLSDDGKGRAPSASPYFGTRFSNGEVWAEDIEGVFIKESKDTKNYALGGATANGPDLGSADPARASTLSGQVGAVLEDVVTSAVQPGANPLVSVWMGANDLFGIAGTPLSAPLAPNDEGLKALAEGVAGLVAQSIGQLAANPIYQFENFVVMNLPDLDAAPLYTLAAPQFASNAAIVTEAYNTALTTNMALLEASLGINVIEVDVNALFDEINGADNPLGFFDRTNPCVFEAVNFNCAPIDPSFASAFLFQDLVHPTRPAHAFLAERTIAAVEAEISAVPLPASAPLMIAGFALLGWQARRRAAA